MRPNEPLRPQPGSQPWKAPPTAPLRPVPTTGEPWKADVKVGRYIGWNRHRWPIPAGGGGATPTSQPYHDQNHSCDSGEPLK